MTTCASLAVEEAVSNAVSLVHFYSDRNPYDKDPQNPWNDPQAMLADLDQARDKIMVAWTTLETEQEQQDITKQHQDVRALYMGMITDAFADVLDDLRQTTDPNELDVDILVDCLQSGLDLLTAEERGLLCSMQDDDYDDDDDDGNFVDVDIAQDDIDDADADADHYESQNLVSCQ